MLAILLRVLVEGVVPCSHGNVRITNVATRSDLMLWRNILALRHIYLLSGIAPRRSFACQMSPERGSSTRFGAQKHGVLKIRDAMKAIAHAGRMTSLRIRQIRMRQPHHT